MDGRATQLMVGGLATPVFVATVATVVSGWKSLSAITSTASPTSIVSRAVRIMTVALLGCTCKTIMSPRVRRGRSESESVLWAVIWVSSAGLDLRESDSLGSMLA